MPKTSQATASSNWAVPFTTATATVCMAIILRSVSIAPLVQARQRAQSYGLEVIAMTHPDIAQALATAHREDLLRAAATRTGVVVTRNRRRERGRLVAWLDAQRLRRRRVAGIRTTACMVGSR